MSTVSVSKLFQPIQVGDASLQHRVVLAPLTRYRATASHIPLVPQVKEYYTQRSSTPGTLLISEAAYIAAKAGGYTNVPGIWNDEQIAAWKEALGRAAKIEVLTEEDPHFSYVSASNIPCPGYSGTPRPLTIDEIKEYIGLYATAAANAVHKAGFDGVEIHGAHGYLVDQFLEDVTNQRTDEYGGSIENRARFGLEIVEAVSKAVGQKKTAIRLSPWRHANGMRMSDPKPTFSYFVSTLASKYPDLAYLHVVEPRVDWIDPLLKLSPEELAVAKATESNDFIRKIWAPRPLISAGAFTRDAAIAAADNKGDLIAFGRFFISNPDLPFRLRNDLPLNPYDRSTFYLPGDGSGRGYTDYPFYTA